jgi:hypothetical protein
VISDIARFERDGELVAKRRIERTNRARFSLDETMDFSEDTGSPVLEDYADKTPCKSVVFPTI